MIFLGRVLTYLSANQLFLLALCLGLGVLLGKVKMGKFPMNATLGTLFVAFVINLLFHVGINEVTAALSAANLDMKKLGIELVPNLSYPDMLSNLFFALFSFALGYSAGPDFWETMRKNGLKQIGIHALMVVFYCACVVGVTMGTCSLLGITHPGNVNGLLAGAQTQSAILDQLKTGDDPAQKQLIQGNQMVIFGLTYIIGVLLMTLFAQFVAPRLLGTTLPSAVKKYIDAATEKKQFSGPADSVIPTKAIQQRAYRVMPGSPAIGKTVEEFEIAGKRRFEVITIHRGSDYLEEDLFQSTKIEQGDVLVLVGDARAIFNVRDKYLEETVDNQYLSMELQSAEIVITEKEEDLEKDKRDIRLAITNRGVLLQDVQRKGRRLAPGDAGKLEAGDMLHVTGLKREIDALAKDYGYIKDNGAPSSIPAVALALAAAVLLGSISLFGLSIGTSCCITLLGIMGTMLYYNVKLSLYIFLVIPVIVAATCVFRHFTRKIYRAIRAKISELNGFVAEHVSGSVEAFAALMNARAAALGADARFVTPNGLDAAGHGASARAMASSASRSVPYSLRKRLIRMME